MKDSRKDIESDLVFDPLKCYGKILSRKGLMLKAFLAGAVIGAFVAFCIPKEYKTTITIAPEIQESGSSILSGVASSMGTRSGFSKDVYQIMLYPDIIGSTPFLIDLFDVPVRSKDGSIQTDFYDYMDNVMVKPWWESIVSFVKNSPSKMARTLKKLTRGKNKGADEDDESGRKVDPSRLTIEQRAIMTDMRKAIRFSTEPGSTITAINVKLQDPHISAAMADTVLDHFQRFILDYRTQKVREELDNLYEMMEEAKAEYEKAESEYASFMDMNHDLFLQSQKEQQDKLNRDKDIAYSTLSSYQKQEILLKARIQEKMPVLTIVQPSVVPIKPTSNRFSTIITFALWALFLAMLWVVTLKDVYEEIKQAVKSNLHSRAVPETKTD